MLIQDIKPYKPFTGRVARIQLEASKLHRKIINVQHVRSDGLTWHELCNKYWLYDQEQYNRYHVTEDDLIQEQSYPR